MAEHARFIGTPGEFYGGIPARDLDPDEYAALGDDERALVKASPLYRVERVPEPRPAKVDKGE